MATKKLIEINATEDVSRPADFAITNGVPAEEYVSSLFTSVDTSTDPAASGLLSNAKLDKSIVKVASSMLPITLNTFTSGGSLTAADGHAYAYSFAASGSSDITISFPDPVENTSPIFQVSFTNTSTENDMDVQFAAGSSVVKFDSSDCGKVPKATTSEGVTTNGASILSAMWDGSAWNLVWKNKS